MNCFYISFIFYCLKSDQSPNKSKPISGWCNMGLVCCSYDARKQGLTGFSHAAFVARSIGGYGFQCGLVAAIFTSTRCGLQRYRRKDDLVNALVAGAVAGATVAAGTRNLKQVVGTTCLVSAFSTAADYFRTM
uniref:Uncharacterized protein n=2 Tax=Cannabis sativa TaxID=3483 RepID=A0A803NQU0_CANSA